MTTDLPEGIRVIVPGPPNFGFDGPTQLRCRIDVDEDADLGPRQVFVTNPDGLAGGIPPYNRFFYFRGHAPGQRRVRRPRK